MMTTKLEQRLNEIIASHETTLIELSLDKSRLQAEVARLTRELQAVVAAADAGDGDASDGVYELRRIAHKALNEPTGGSDSDEIERLRTEVERLKGALTRCYQDRRLST